MYINKQLSGWTDTAANIFNAGATIAESRRAADVTKSTNAARIAEANASVAAAKLALDAENARASNTGSLLSSTPVLVGGAAILAGVLFLMIRRRGR
jgi:hypothetical protein